jgi:GNAT superfamily N-acetyltransferase
MSRFTITVDENPAPADLVRLEHVLAAHNESKSEPRDYTPLVLFIRNGEGEIVGGLRGVTVWGWLFVSQLWVDEDLRGQDYGSNLMTTAETEARRRNCHAGYVDTFSFLALGFTKNLGTRFLARWRIFPKDIQDTF